MLEVRYTIPQERLLKFYKNTEVHILLMKFFNGKKLQTRQGMSYKWWNEVVRKAQFCNYGKKKKNLSAIQLKVQETHIQVNHQ